MSPAQGASFPGVLRAEFGSDSIPQNNCNPPVRSREAGQCPAVGWQRELQQGWAEVTSPPGQRGCSQHLVSSKSCQNVTLLLLQGPQQDSCAGRRGLPRIAVTGTVLCRVGRGWCRQRAGTPEGHLKDACPTQWEEWAKAFCSSHRKTLWKGRAQMENRRSQEKQVKKEETHQV